MAKAPFFSCIIAALIWATTAMADEYPVQFKGPFIQGSMIIGKTTSGAKVTVDGKPIRISASGRFIFGFGRDYEKMATIAVTLTDGVTHSRKFSVEKRSYKVQHIDGLKKAMVSPGEKALQRIRRESKLVAAARAHDTAEAWFETGFIWPATGPISGVYGSQRILNGQPRRPHYGVDVAVPTGTPVVATSDGRVTLAEDDLYFTGGSIIIDHGHGITSTYIHLSAVDVEVRQVVKQGDRIGAVGATGRVTGPHLDWRLNWFKERLDPQLVVPPMPK